MSWRICRKAAPPELDLVFSGVPGPAARPISTWQSWRTGLPSASSTITSPRASRRRLCTILNASIYVFERAFLLENETGFLWDGTCGIYQMFDTGIIDIDSEEDYRLMEAIARHLYAAMPSFSACGARRSVEIGARRCFAGLERRRGTRPGAGCIWQKAAGRVCLLWLPLAAWRGRAVHRLRLGQGGRLHACTCSARGAGQRDGAASGTWRERWCALRSGQRKF